MTYKIQLSDIFEGAKRFKFKVASFVLDQDYSAFPVRYHRLVMEKASCD